MALTITPLENRQPFANYWERIVDVTFDASYPTGGESFLPGDVGFSLLLAIDAETVNGASVRSIGWDQTNQKLLAYAPGGAEVAALTNLSAVTVRCVARGRG